MPLEAYPRGSVWWAKGRVDYNGRDITGYIRESTGASSEAGAKDWIVEREDRERRRFLLGEEHVLTFADAVMLYDAEPQMAEYLAPLVVELGHLRVKDVSPALIRSLGPKLYPMNATDTWRRWVITPARAVINNAHDLGKCAPIVVKGYTAEERIEQDERRGKQSRIERKPGSWEWLLRFREHARPYHSALALFMFATGARVGQAVEMHPKRHLKLQEGKACVPGAKGHADRWIEIPPEVVAELANLPPKVPRRWPWSRANLRVFGFADRTGPLQGWATACRLAGIEYLPPHSSGRHGFGQEFNVRQPVDEKAAGKFGGWADTALMRKTYTHAEAIEPKIHAAFRTGLVQAEMETGLKLLRERA